MSDRIVKNIELYKSAIFSYVYRLIGSVEDAKDITQETMLKYISLRENNIENTKAWMFKVATNLSLDFFKSAKTKREKYIGPWLPEPYIDETKTVEEDIEIDESISVALLVLLEKLSPYERISYILHDLFEFKHKEIATILNISVENSRKLTSRANKKLVENKKSFSPTAKEQISLTKAFIEAAKNGNFDNLMLLFASEVKLHSDGGGKAIAAKKIICRDNKFISKFLQKVISSLFAKNENSIELKTFWFNGALGILQIEENKITTSYHFEIESSKIVSIFALRNPDKLKYFACHIKNRVY
ncbi:MAG: polymerase sigma factor SigJ [Pseudomonadota bacterium]|jgi:RNA polymerase sigma-70 factor (ECF subfamily)